jgi:serine/threonine protein kinase
LKKETKMAEPAINSIVSQPLAELLAAGPSWTLQERLALAERLAAAIQALHSQGRTHRALDAATVTVDERLQPQLGPPAGPRYFGGEQSDPEFCPPELAFDVAVELPAEIEAAAAILQDRGLAIDPRRVDVYQFGVLLCQLLTGESLLSYRYSTSAKAKVPPVARAVLDRCLGEGAAPPLADCQGLIEALDESLRQAADGPPPAVRETPARDPYRDAPAGPCGRYPSGDPGYWVPRGRRRTALRALGAFSGHRPDWPRRNGRRLQGLRRHS